MRKFLYLAMIAVLAVVATGCKNRPSSLKGTWEDRGIFEVDGYQVESIWTLTVTGSEDTNAPGMITHVYGGREYENENILVNYSDGKGTLTSADGSKHIEGTIKAEAKDELEINLDENGYPTLRNARFLKK